MMAQQWFYSKSGQRQGPITAEKLKELAASGQLASTDLVWKEGMSQWLEARKVKGLLPSAPATSKEPPPLPVTAASAAPSAIPPDAASPVSTASKPKTAWESPTLFGLDLSPIINHPKIKIALQVVGTVLAGAVIASIFISSESRNARSGGQSGNTKVSTTGESRPNVMSRDEFRRAVMGKTTEEVLSVLGRPDRTHEYANSWQLWYYDDRCKDNVTGRVDRNTQVSIRGNVVDNVTF